MSYFILVDCNNFYVSCERIFNSRLEGRPVIVLSNNDGCVVARSQEARLLGIRMGEPFFKIKNFCLHRNVFVFSSNYRLYGSISQRIMNALALFTPDVQVYSIDEAFLKFPQTTSLDEIEKRCAEIRGCLKKWLGIPVSIGIAQTKTLAKAANKMAKENRQTGICSLISPEVTERSLKNLSTGDIWGIGSKQQATLRSMGIYTAWEFREMDPSVVRNKMGVVGERILWELRGTSCLPFAEVRSAKQSITCSRSFGTTQTELASIQEALSTFTAIACEKLRKEHCCAAAICVFAETLTNSETGARQHYSSSTAFPVPTNDTPLIITTAKNILARLFQQHQRYKKCGIILLDLAQEDSIAPDLFSRHSDQKRRNLAQTIDTLNCRFGKNTIFYGAMGVNPQWKMKSEKSSRHYTTSWDDLLIVS